MLQRGYEFEKRYFRIHILHLVYITFLSDLCFNKKFEQEKKVYVTKFQAAGLQLCYTLLDSGMGVSLQKLQ